MVRPNNVAMGKLGKLIVQDQIIVQPLLARPSLAVGSFLKYIYTAALHIAIYSYL